MRGVYYLANKGLICTAFLAACTPLAARAQSTSQTLSSSEDIESGEAGANAGTSFYNTLNPTTPLPVSKGNVIRDTVRGVGQGKTTTEAFKDAAEQNAGIPK